jgi:hypothetical protein
VIPGAEAAQLGLAIIDGRVVQGAPEPPAVPAAPAADPAPTSPSGPEKSTGSKRGR